MNELKSLKLTHPLTSTHSRLSCPISATFRIRALVTDREQKERLRVFKVLRGRVRTELNADSVTLSEYDIDRPISSLLLPPEEGEA